MGVHLDSHTFRGTPKAIVSSFLSKERQLLVTSSDQVLLARCFMALSSIHPQIAKFASPKESKLSDLLRTTFLTMVRPICRYDPSADLLYDITTEADRVFFLKSATQLMVSTRSRARCQDYEKIPKVSKNLFGNCFANHEASSLHLTYIQW